MYEVALAFSVLCFVTVSVWYIRSPLFSFFHPFTFYTAFHGLIFVFRPIVARILDFQEIYRAFQFFPSESDKLTAILASNVGYLAFAFFCLRSGSVPMRFAIDKFTIEERIRLGRFMPWVIAIISPISIYSLVTLWNEASSGSGMTGVVMDNSTGVFMHTATTGYLYEAQLMLASACTLLAWIYRFHFLSLIPFALFIIGRSGTGGRGPFVIALAALGLIFLYENRKRFANIKIITISILAIFLFNIVGSDRGALVRSLTSGENAEGRAYYVRDDLQFMEGMDLGNLEFFEYLIYVVPQRSGTYDYFLNNFQLFTEPIPRMWWKGKPAGAPFKRIFLFDYGRPIGITYSLPGMGWYCFGWLGVIIWCGLWGHTLGWIYRKYVEGPQNTLQTAAYMIFLPILIIAYRDGSVITIFRQGLFYMTPIVIWYGISKTVAIPSASLMRRRALRRWRRARLEAKRDAILAGEAPLATADVTPVAPREVAHREAEGRTDRLSRRRRMAYQKKRLLME
jgi:hypothetical protein